jgi:hypothetical protein
MAPGWCVHQTNVVSLVHRNQAWFDILAPKTRDIELGDAWDALIDEQHVPLGQAKFEALMETKQHQSLELRLKRTFDVSKPNSNDPNPPQEPMWVLLSIFPELTEDGEVIEIIGCFTDIRYVLHVALHRPHHFKKMKHHRNIELQIHGPNQAPRKPTRHVEAGGADSIISFPA